jgi:molybdopterin-guanine dinucleotide biosynthesis protein A
MLAGIVVGGAASRMGGAPKGLLVADGRTIVDRLREALEGAGLEVVLVGAHEAYASLGLRSIPDEPAGVGPIGGLAALLAAAEGGRAMWVACDMPRVTSALVRRLVDAPPAAVVAPRRAGRWEPLFARFDSAAALPVVRARISEGELGLQGLFDALGAVELPTSEAERELLEDWDTPEDLAK